MAQESISNKSVAIIGAGPAGIICAIKLLQFGIIANIFEKSKPLKTILPTGGGRCNLAHAEYDFKELARNYPRGEKFLYSIFSRYSTADTLEFFKTIGIETYTQEDNRIFPTSNSSKDVQEKLLKASKKCKFIHEEVLEIDKLENCCKIITTKSTYAFDFVVIATGGHCNFKMFNPLGINIIPTTPSLVGLVTKEDFSAIAGVAIKNVKWKNLQSDILFTHKGISGPLIYKISSIKARDDLPYTISLQLIDSINLQAKLEEFPHKSIKNFLGTMLPKSFAEYILNKLKILPEIPCHKINGEMRDLIINKLINFEVKITGKVPDGEVVNCGGIDLKEINPKTMEFKKHSGIYFCGEVLDIDGYCGGFNLQNCWSTGSIVADSIAKYNF